MFGCVKFAIPAESLETLGKVVSLETLEAISFSTPNLGSVSVRQKRPGARGHRDWQNHGHLARPGNGGVE